MTPKEKAKELVDRFVKLTYSVNKFNYITELEYEVSKQCALICVDEILLMAKNDFWRMSDIYLVNKTIYWEQVKQEINNL